MKIVAGELEGREMEQMSREKLVDKLKAAAMACRTEWLRHERGVPYNPQVILDFAQLATPGNILELCSDLPSLRERCAREEAEAASLRARDEGRLKAEAEVARLKAGWREMLHVAECLSEERIAAEMDEWMARAAGKEQG